MCSTAKKQRGGAACKTPNVAGCESGLLVRTNVSLNPGEKVLWITDQRTVSKTANSHSVEAWERGSLSQGLPKETSGKKVEGTTRLLSLPLRKMRERWSEDDLSVFKQNLDKIWRNWVWSKTISHPWFLPAKHFKRKKKKVQIGCKGQTKHFFKKSKRYSSF
jgi:hypothetical protein